MFEMIVVKTWYWLQIVSVTCKSILVAANVKVTCVTNAVCGSNVLSVLNCSKTFPDRLKNLVCCVMIHTFVMFMKSLCAPNVSEKKIFLWLNILDIHNEVGLMVLIALLAYFG